MKKMMMIMVVMIGGQSFAQVDSDSLMLKWGVGIIRPKDVMESDAFSFPRGWITVYDANRNAFGKLRKICFSAEDSSYPVLELFVPDRDTVRDLDIEKDVIEITYDWRYLTFYDSDGSYVSILNNVAPELDLWIRISQLDDLGFRTQLWPDFMAERSIFYYPLFHQIGYLRKEPSDSAEVVLEITDENNKTYEIVLTENWQGNWAYATVELLTEIYGRDRKVLGRWQGWIKVVDEKGYPLIWYYSRGC